MSQSSSNPKDRTAQSKIDLALVPPVGIIHAAHALADGAKKYTPYNWRRDKVRATVYLAAAQRHLAAYLDGEDVATDSGVHHLAHVLGGMMIVLDAGACGMLIDDRPPSGEAARLLDVLADEVQHRGTMTGPWPEAQCSTSQGGLPEDLGRDIVTQCARLMAELDEHQRNMLDRDQK